MGSSREDGSEIACSLKHPGEFEEWDLGEFRTNGDIELITAVLEDDFFGDHDGRATLA